MPNSKEKLNNDWENKYLSIAGTTIEQINFISSLLQELVDEMDTELFKKVIQSQRSVKDKWGLK